MEIIEAINNFRELLIPYVKQIADFIIPNLHWIIIILFGSLYIVEFLINRYKRVSIKIKTDSSDDKNIN
jgi:hypothetical protein